MNEVINKEIKYPTDAKEFWQKNERDNKALNDFIDKISDIYSLIYKTDFSYNLKKERGIKKRELIDCFRGQPDIHVADELKNVLLAAREYAAEKVSNAELDAKKYSVMLVTHYNEHSLNEMNKLLKDSSISKDKRGKAYNRMVAIRGNMQKDQKGFDEIKSLMNNEDMEIHNNSKLDSKSKFEFFNKKYLESKEKKERYESSGVTANELEKGLSQAKDFALAAIETMKSQNQEVEKELKGIEGQLLESIKGWQKELENLRGEKSTPSK